VTRGSHRAAKKRYKLEAIVSLPQREEVLYGRGMSMADAIRHLGISEVTFYRWRKEYAAMSGDRLRRLKVLGQPRLTQRRVPCGGGDEDRQVADMIELARQYGRTAVDRSRHCRVPPAGQVNDKRIERLRRCEELKVPGKHSTRVGAAQDTIAVSIELPVILQAGRWKSAAMVNRYGDQLQPHSWSIISCSAIDIKRNASRPFSGTGLVGPES